MRWQFRAGPLCGRRVHGGGGNVANYIAKWNGSGWSALGSGMSIINPGVCALAVSGTDLYAAGGFTTADASSSDNYIVKWTGSNWSALGSGMNGTVRALAVLGSDLCVGNFEGREQLEPAREMEREQLEALAGGLTYCVCAGSVGQHPVCGGRLHDGELDDERGQSYRAMEREQLVRARFRDGRPCVCAGCVGQRPVCGRLLHGRGRRQLHRQMERELERARFRNGNERNSFSLRVCLGGVGHELYAGGQFETAGGTPANGIAKWNGSSWSALGSGMNGWVYALAVSGSDLYVGGDFTTAGGSAANYIAKWNGSSWSALGSGMNSYCERAGGLGQRSVCRGLVLTAGGKGSAYVARAYLDLPTLSIFRSGGDVTLSWPVYFGGFALQQSPDVANPTVGPLPTTRSSPTGRPKAPPFPSHPPTGSSG